MLLLGDCNDWLKEINDNSIDLICTDPPYGIEFMGKDWDKALVQKETWKECYRVLKEGKLAFVMCSPRQDVLSRMIINLQDAGFRTNYTSIYWTYASGFPKAANVSKLIDKKYKPKQEYYDLGCYLKENRERLGLSQKDIAKHFPSVTGGLTGCVWNWESAMNVPTQEQYQILKQKLGLDDRFDWLIEQETKRYEEAEREVIGKRNDGVSNPNCNTICLSPKSKKEIDITKPATEAAKKMEGAYVGFQPKPAVEVILVVSKGKTLTWLDDCRIPYQSEDDLNNIHNATSFNNKPIARDKSVSYEYIERENKTIRDFSTNEKGRFPANLLVSSNVLNNGEDYSRYFSLDSWADKTFPFIITPKASRSERGEFNNHPTVKSLKLMSYLITMGSREGDLVLDPFCGSGTVCIAADQLHRKWIGIEKNEEYAAIIKKRLMVPLSQLKLTVFE